MLPLLHYADLFFDSGLLILIWVVQLIIYPSFATKAQETFVQWHAVYSQRISLFVIPLMFGQVICTTLLVFNHPSWVNYFSAILIALVWFATFLRAVPLHRRFAQNDYQPIHFKQLCQRNWSRTVLWTSIFLLNFVPDGYP